MVSIIVAIAANGVIGDKNSLLWHIKEDMRFFRQKTTSHPVIMGRKTYDSLGRPLPNRTNVVISRTLNHIEGCTVVHSLEEAIALFPSEEEIFIIGGAQIYAQALDVADRMYITRIEHSYEGDTSFPEWDRAQWRLVEKESMLCGENFRYPFSFETYIRIK
ncbi:MAG: dihydrofolate reductase [Rikenellaceae bacterium]|nr:dihydrofolate reductase [Rikenellaceae bacterium]